MGYKSLVHLWAQDKCFLYVACGVIALVIESVKWFFVAMSDWNSSIVWHLPLKCESF